MEQASKTTKVFGPHSPGAARIESLCRPGSVPSYVNGFGGTLAVTSPVPYISFFSGPPFFLFGGLVKPPKKRKNRLVKKMRCVVCFALVVILLYHHRRYHHRDRARRRTNRQPCIAKPDPPYAVRTRGEAGCYRQVGILSAESGPVPLYGRPTGSGGRWNYYSVSNQTLPQKMPVFVNGRDCERLQGCPEASDGETLDVRGLGSAVVTLYTRDV
jgi:hypothetical protein